MAFTTTELLSRIRARGVLDGTEADYTDAVLLDLADQVIAEQMVPRILATNGDYYLVYRDIAITVGRYRYPIPHRSMFSKIHSVYLLDSTKSTETILYFVDRRNTRLGVSGTPQYHTINDNYLILHDSPTIAGYLRIYFFYSPSVLVLPSSTMVVTGRSAGKLLGTPPTGFSGGEGGGNVPFDIVSASTPFELVSFDLTGTVAADGVTFALSDLDLDRIDDGKSYIVTLAGQTSYPMMPRELHYVLADLVSCPVLHNQGDEGWSERYMDSQKKMIDVIAALFQRKQSETKPMFVNNSLMRYFR